jgi:hypothetical protein
LGNKFVPNFFENKNSFLNFLLEDIDNNFLKFNTFFIFLKQNFDKKDNSLNNITKQKNTIEEPIKLVEDNQPINDIFMKDFYCKINRRKFKPKYLFDMSKEVLEFRSEIHIEILECINIIKNTLNTSPNLINTLKTFQKKKLFTVLSCDKNVGSALISNDLYLKLAHEFLEKDLSYTKLDNNPLESTINKINFKLDELFLDHHISKKFRDCLVVPCDSKLGSFRLLAKMHKVKFGWRPIINSINHPTSKVCYFLDFIFKPHVLKSDSYIKDSQNLIQMGENMCFEKEPYLYSLDFSSLYSNIDPKLAIPVIIEFMKDFLDTHHIDTFGLKEVMQLIFDHNIFQFKGVYYVQNKGVAMGCICGPSFANLYLRILETKWLFRHKPLLYVRFIDDIFMALKEALDFLNFQEHFNNLKLTMTHGKDVVFLDTVISYNRVKTKLQFDLYIKPTNSGGYLLPISEHTEHIFNNIPRNLFLRIRRICSDYRDFVLHSKNLALILMDRGYNKNNLSRSFNQVSLIDRYSLIPYKIKYSKIKEENSIIFTKTFNSGLNIKSIFRNAFNKTVNLEGKFKLKLVNRIGKNLESLLVNNFKPYSNSLYFTKPCKKCVVCGVINNKPSIFINHYNFDLDMKCSGTCDTSHLVYIISCKLCNKLYIGETEKTLSVRIKQHLNHIRKFIPYHKYHDKVVAKHFNMKGHSISNFKCCIFQKDLFSTFERKSVERDLIRFLNHRKNECMNIDISDRINTLAFAIE